MPGLPHLQCLPVKLGWEISGEEPRISNTCRCSWRSIACACVHLGCIVHTWCHYYKMVATAVGNRISNTWRVSSYMVGVQHLSTNRYVPLVSCDSVSFTSITTASSSLQWIQLSLLSTFRLESELSQLWSLESGL